MYVKFLQINQLNMNPFLHILSAEFWQWKYEAWIIGQCGWKKNCKLKINPTFLNCKPIQFSKVIMLSAGIHLSNVNND